MENATDIIATIERLGGFLILLLGAIGVLYTAITTGRKGMLEASAKSAKDKQEGAVAKKKADIEAAQAVQTLYDNLVEDMNDRFQSMGAEMDTLSEKYKKDIKELQERQSETDCRLQTVTQERNTFKEAGLRLIHAIEEGLELRAGVSADLNNCKACTLSDQALLKTLQEVKALFENGGAI